MFELILVEHTWPTQLRIGLLFELPLPGVGTLAGRIEVRAPRQGDKGILVAVPGSDPLNLVGLLTPGPRIAALTGNRVLYRDGVPVAALTAGEVSFFGKPTRPPNGRHVGCCCAERCGRPRSRRSWTISR